MKRRQFFSNSMTVAGALAIRTAGAAPAFAKPQAPPPLPSAPGLTRYVCEFIVNTKYEDIPAAVLALGRKSILDGFGLALAGSVSEMGPLVRQYIGSFSSSDAKSSVVGSGIRVPARFAAMANGIFIHADDYDDTQLSVAPDRVYGLLAHPTVTTLPPAFALAELNRGSGKDMMLAYQIGVEVECKIAEAIAPRHYESGFHTTGTIGTFGSAAVCAKLMRFNQKQTASALSIAASEGSGLRNNFG